jgi:hypothetical protein
MDPINNSPYKYHYLLKTAQSRYVIRSEVECLFSIEYGILRINVLSLSPRQDYYAAIRFYNI